MSDEVLDRVNTMAKTLNRSRTWVINQAVERFLSYEEWFVREVQAGLDEARRGEFAKDEEVAARFEKWGVNAD
jgi:predicted transcriptional regulator